MKEAAAIDVPGDTHLHDRPTRGGGLAEGMLSTLRRIKASRLIPRELRKGRVLDVGCGAFPRTLLELDFGEKWGVDRVFDAATQQRCEQQGVHLVRVDLGTCDALPFESDSFEAITMLAVAEHLPRPVLLASLREARRLLKPAGVMVLTTPAPWTEPLLTLLAWVGLISREEIGEHQPLLDFQELSHLFTEAGFAPEQVTCGYFELFLNTWFCARR